MPISSVYLAEFADPAGNVYLKVGKANNPVKRLAGLQVGCPFDLSRMRHIAFKSERTAYRCERAIQAALAKYHVRGEWFIAPAGDDAARLALEIAPAEIAAAIVKAPIRVNSLSMEGYEAAKRAYFAVYGDSKKRKGGRTAKA